MVRWFFALSALTLLTGACASRPIASDTNRPSTAIYLPPATVGGPGRVLFMPTSNPQPPGMVSAPLETPDAMPTQPTAAWLLGVWLFAATPDHIDRFGCNSGVPESFDEDGIWEWFYGEGSWELRDGVLTRAALSTWDIGSPGEKEDDEAPDGYEVGKSYSNRINRIGPDEGALFDAGAWQPMLRCRPGDFNVPAQ